ncbi:MAG: hypothetical protein EOP46_00710 [Sphingobacteriaceae bacterium]|nr:MAG: hypothetical protein EOP46_00710 [Sphingobacteriaceae bacterium]
MVKLPTLILLTLVVGFSITSCKKQHTITYGPVIPIEKDTVLIKVNFVETVKGTDRDGDYYTDVFHLENKKDLKFVKARHNAIPNNGIDENIVFEDSTEGPRISLTRRQKNARYQLETVWSMPHSTDTYEFKYQFAAANEQ